MKSTRIEKVLAGVLVVFLVRLALLSPHLWPIITVSILGLVVVLRFSLENQINRWLAKSDPSWDWDDEQRYFNAYLRYAVRKAHKQCHSR